MVEAEKLRVAMIIQSYLPRLGGAEKQLAALCRRLRKLDIEPTVITRRYAGMRRFELIDQTPVYRVPAPQPKPLAALCYIFFGLLKLQKINVNILHAHELLSPSDLAILGGQLLKKPVMVKVLRGGGLGDLDKLHRRRGGRARIRRLRENAAAFIVISREIERELAAEGIEPARCFYIPNGVDVEIYKPILKAAKKKLRREMKLPEEGFLCMYSGRLAPEKGLTFLLQAWEQIVKRHPDARLLMLGSGEMESSLRASADKGVMFGGFAPEPLPFYQAADAFILPSETEGLSNAMLEAMACGLAVAASRVGAAADLIEHGENGLLFPAGNAAEIAQALESFIRSPGERQRLGAAARQRVCRDYSLDQTAEKLAALYRGLVGKEAAR